MVQGSPSTREGCGGGTVSINTLVMPTSRRSPPLAYCFLLPLVTTWKNGQVYYCRLHHFLHGLQRQPQPEIGLAEPIETDNRLD